MLSMLRGAVLLAAVAATLTARSAFAHAEFVTSDPAPGATLATAPTQVRIVFTQAISRSSTIVVTGPSGEVVSGPTMVSGNVAITPIQATAPGVYQVQWANTSLEDGHERSGSFQFTLVAGAASRGQTQPPARVQAAPPTTMPRTGAGPAEKPAGPVTAMALIATAALGPTVAWCQRRDRRYGHVR